MTEFEWALQMPQSEHQLANLQLKSAACKGNGEIVLVATGSQVGKEAQINGLLLHFRVNKVASQW